MDKKILFLSYFLNQETPIYGGEKGVIINSERSIKNGDTANTKRIVIHNHSGTHIDFPNHFFEAGNSSSKYSADFWVFNHPYLINIDVEPNELIDLNNDQISNIPYDTDFLIIKSGFGKFRDEEIFWKNNPGISSMLAKKLQESLPCLRVLGVDMISITSYQNREDGRHSHRYLLGGEREILIIEDMNLSGLNKSPNQIIALPILIDNIDGAPINIIAYVD